jgi:hypothetical protein
LRRDGDENEDNDSERPGGQLCQTGSVESAHGQGARGELASPIASIAAGPLDRPGKVRQLIAQSIMAPADMPAS